MDPEGFKKKLWQKRLAEVAKLQFPIPNFAIVLWSRVLSFRGLGFELQYITLLYSCSVPKDFVHSHDISWFFNFKV